ncbi:hypothetical protein ACOMHN_039741 [Nucella lapillus]
MTEYVGNGMTIAGLVSLSSGARLLGRCANICGSARPGSLQPSGSDAGSGVCERLQSDLWKVTAANIHRAASDTAAAQIHLLPFVVFMFQPWG